MTDYPTEFTREQKLEALEGQIACIIRNQFDFLVMSSEKRIVASEEAARIITKLIANMEGK